MFATHTSLFPSPTRRFQVYFELRAAHDRAGEGVKHSTRVVLASPPVIQPREGLRFVAC